MKASVAITLIIVGSLLVAIPPAHDLARMGMGNGNSVFPSGALTSEYRFGCWFLGAMMIGVSVLASCCGRATAADAIRREAVAREPSMA